MDMHALLPTARLLLFIPAPAALRESQSFQSIVYLSTNYGTKREEEGGTRHTRGKVARIHTDRDSAVVPSGLLARSGGEASTIGRGGRIFWPPAEKGHDSVRWLLFRPARFPLEPLLRPGAGPVRR